MFTNLVLPVIPNDSLEVLTFLAVLLFAGALAYKSKFLHQQKIGYFSLLQAFYLVLLPGIFYSILFYSVLDIISRPLNETTFLNDRLLTSLLLLSFLYTYAGIAIHGVSKTVTSYFRSFQKPTLAYKVNSFFHNEFSHNLTYTGALFSATFFALLELNHVSPYPEGVRWLTILLNSLFIGFSSFGALFFYEKKRWSELKFFFFSLWAVFAVLLYAVKPYLTDLKQYPFLLTILIVFTLLNLLNFFLTARRVRGQLRIIFRIPKRLFP